MELSLPSLFSSSLALTILILILYVIIKINRMLKHLGVICIYCFALMILIRGFLPFEVKVFHITKTYPSNMLIPMVQNIVNTSLTKSSSFTILTLLIFLWLFIASIKLSKKIVGYYVYYKKIFYITCSQRTKAYGNKCSTRYTKHYAVISSNITEIFYLASNKIFKKNIPCHLLQLNNLNTPAVFGLITPTIILPNIPYNDKDLYYIFLHELLHIKHKDFFVKILCDILSALYWWNPIISILYPLLIRQLQELKVDYFICKLASKKTKSHYLECIKKTIVYSANRSHKNSHSLYSFCDNSSNKKIMQRLKFITMKNDVNNRFNLVHLLIFFVIILLSFSFIVEAFNQPEFSEKGEKVFYKNKVNSYFIKNGSEYDLYLSGKYVYTTSVIIPDFQDLPIYSQTPSKRGGK